MDLTSIPPEALESLVDNLSRTAHLVLQSYADDNDIATNWRTIISFRLADNDLFHIQRTGCDIAIIFVNGYEFVSLDKSNRSQVAKFKFAAFKAIKLAASLSTTGNALITGDLAYAINRERKRLRREVISLGYNALDDRYFRVGGTLTLADKLSGRVLSAPINTIIPLEDQLSSLKHALSLIMLQDSETEEVIDLLETRRNHMNSVVEEPPTSYTISSVGNSVSTHVEYRNTNNLSEN
jgi:hypothetical protein